MKKVSSWRSVSKALAHAGLLGAFLRIVREHGVDVRDVLAGDRHPGPTAARHAAWSMLHNADPKAFSMARIGQLFGRDHTTVFAGIRKVAAHVRPAQCSHVGELKGCA